jgi:ATP-dependent DNA helicase RecQ
VRGEEREQWEALRALRRKLAEEHGVPPYVIFPDSTLLEMLRSQPTSLAEMATVSGVGARKLERYGEAFLEVLGGAARGAESGGRCAPRTDHPGPRRHDAVADRRSVAVLGKERLHDARRGHRQAAVVAGAGAGLPEELMGEVQDAFLDGEGELPPVAEIAELFAGRVPEGVLYCVRAALQSEFEM